MEEQVVIARRLLLIFLQMVLRIQAQEEEAIQIIFLEVLHCMVVEDQVL